MRENRSEKIILQHDIKSATKVQCYTLLRSLKPDFRTSATLHLATFFFPLFLLQSELSSVIARVQIIVS
jgi:hypothetical protein